jgi:hypothetical protein
MLSDACHVVADALTRPERRPVAVERALNAFAEVMDASEDAGECNPAFLWALRQAIKAVLRGALAASTLVEMARAVHRHLEGMDTLTDAQLVRALGQWNALARAVAPTPAPMPAAQPSRAAAPGTALIRIRDVVDVLDRRGGSVYPHALRTGLANRFPSATPQEVDTAVERAIACYALTVTPMGKVCRVPRD